MSWTEITILVDKAKTGDAVAYGELVKRFQNSVYAMALTRVRNAVDAEELTQEVFIHGMRKLPQLRDPRCFAGWLRRITARMAINRQARRGPVRGAGGEYLESVPDRGNGPLDQIELGETRAELREGLQRLKELDRLTLEAF